MNDPLILDGVKLQLIVIGEAAKNLPDNLTGSEPDIAWRDIAGMKDWLTHHYFDVDTETLRDTIDRDIPPLVAAVERLRHQIRDGRGLKP